MSESNVRLTCLCGRIFSQDNAYGSHQRSCKHGKKCMSGALDKAKEIFARKKQKITHVALASTVTTTAITPVPTAQLSAEVEVCAISVRVGIALTGSTYRPNTKSLRWTIGPYFRWSIGLAGENATEMYSLNLYLVDHSPSSDHHPLHLYWTQLQTQTVGMFSAFYVDILGRNCRPLIPTTMSQ